LNNYLNFHEYMKLRLMVFSWKHCSVQGPFIEESNFECALEVASGYRTLSKAAARRLFQLGLEMSNLEHLRNLDFISFLYVALSMRIYGKVNGKEDGDITKKEFNLAMDNNILPVRYSQKIIDQFFKLVNQDTKFNMGIDKYTFVFLDNALKLFTVQKAKRPYYINNDEFIGILSSQFFPKKILFEILRIPLTEMDKNSFQMFTSMNISRFYKEDDYLLKFVEVKSKKHGLLQANTTASNETAGNQTDNSTGNGTAGKNISGTIKVIGSRIFNLIDSNNDGFIPFEDFAHMMQLIYVFRKADENYSKGKIPVGKVIEIFKSYSEYPRISFVNRNRVRRLEVIYQDLYLNVFELLVIFKIDDIVDFYVRVSDKTTIYEYDLLHILKKCGLQYIPVSILNRCLRGNDVNNIPKYDWECAVIKGISLMSKFYESVSAYELVKKYQLNLTNTVFENIDPQIK